MTCEHVKLFHVEHQRGLSDLCCIPQRAVLMHGFIRSRVAYDNAIIQMTLYLFHISQRLSVFNAAAELSGGIMIPFRDVSIAFLASRSVVENRF